METPRRRRPNSCIWVLCLGSWSELSTWSDKGLSGPVASEVQGKMGSQGTAHLEASSARSQGHPHLTGRRKVVSRSRPPISNASVWSGMEWREWQVLQAARVNLLLAYIVSIWASERHTAACARGCLWLVWNAWPAGPTQP